MPFKSVPNDVVYAGIFPFINLKDIVNFREVSKETKQVVDKYFSENVMVEMLCDKHGFKKEIFAGLAKLSQEAKESIEFYSFYGKMVQAKASGNFSPESFVDIVLLSGSEKAIEEVLAVEAVSPCLTAFLSSILFAPNDDSFKIGFKFFIKTDFSKQIADTNELKEVIVSFIDQAVTKKPKTLMHGCLQLLLYQPGQKLFQESLLVKINILNILMGHGWFTEVRSIYQDIRDYYIKPGYLKDKLTLENEKLVVLYAAILSCDSKTINDIKLQLSDEVKRNILFHAVLSESPVIFKFCVDKFKITVTLNEFLAALARVGSKEMLRFGLDFLKDKNFKLKTDANDHEISIGYANFFDAIILKHSLDDIKYLLEVFRENKFIKLDYNTLLIYTLCDLVKVGDLEKLTKFIDYFGKPLQGMILPVELCASLYQHLQESGSMEIFQAIDKLFPWDKQEENDIVFIFDKCIKADFFEKFIKYAVSCVSLENYGKFLAKCCDVLQQNENRPFGMSVREQYLKLKCASEALKGIKRLIALNNQPESDDTSREEQLIYPRIR